MNTSTPIVEDDEPRTMAVQIVNHNDFQIVDMFDGIPYRFVPNKPVRIPVDAANHIFGWFPPYMDEDGNRREVDPEVMKRHVQKRFGWNTPSMEGSGRNDMFYGNIELSPIMYRMVPIELDEDGNPVQHAKPAKDANRPPPVNKLMQAADEAKARQAAQP